MTRLVFVAFALSVTFMGSTRADPASQGVAPEVPAASGRDIAGDWEFDISGGKLGSLSGSIKLARSEEPVDGGFQSFKGPVTYTDGTTSGLPWSVGVRGDEVVIVMGVPAFGCAGSFDSRGRINARCMTMGVSYLGSIRMTRADDSK